MRVLVARLLPEYVARVTGPVVWYVTRRVLDDDANFDQCWSLDPDHAHRFDDKTQLDRCHALLAPRVLDRFAFKTEVADA
jgi:hypothetical protein